MAVQKWWRLCLAAGIIVVVVQAVMGTVPNTEPCGPTNGLPAILAFELVRSPADVEVLFGNEPCRSRMIKAMDQINSIDAFLFIPAFVSLLVLGALAVSPQGRLLAALAIVVTIVAGICDQLEDQILLNITASMPGEQSQIDYLFWLVRIKFAMLGIGPVFIGSLLLRMRRLESGLGLLMVAGGIAATIGTLGSYQLMTPGIGIGWIALLIAAARNSFGNNYQRGHTRVFDGE